VITEALFFLVRGVLALVTEVLPEGTLDLPAIGTVGADMAEFAAPVDRFFPVYETFVFLEVLVSVWLPAAAVYSVTVWIYKHLPVLGKG